MEVKIGNSIRELRIPRHISQAELASEIGVTPQTISRWEAGISSPALEYLPDIAVFFGVSVDRLLGVQYQVRELRHDRIYNFIDFLGRTGYGPYAIDVLRQAHNEFPDDLNISLALAKALCSPMWERGTDIFELEYVMRILEDILRRLNDTDLRTDCENLYGFLNEQYHDFFRPKDAQNGSQLQQCESGEIDDCK